VGFKTAIYDNQTEILRWLKSLGHPVVGLDEPKNGRGGFHFRRSCLNKRRFETAEDAIRCEPSQYVYKCPFCPGFHLTQKKPNDRI
jgi:hypothetical protein